MHEIEDIEFELWDEAERISQQYNGAPVILIVGGDRSANFRRTMLASTLHGGSYRLRDLLGTLEACKQIETLKHFRIGGFGQRMRETEQRRRSHSAAAGKPTAGTTEGP